MGGMIQTRNQISIRWSCDWVYSYKMLHYILFIQLVWWYMWNESRKVVFPVCYANMRRVLENWNLRSNKCVAGLLYEYSHSRGVQPLIYLRHIQPLALHSHLTRSFSVGTELVWKLMAQLVKEWMVLELLVRSFVHGPMAYKWVKSHNNRGSDGISLQKLAFFNVVWHLLNHGIMSKFPTRAHPGPSFLTTKVRII